MKYPILMSVDMSVKLDPAKRANIPAAVQAWVTEWSRHQVSDGRDFVVSVKLGSARQWRPIRPPRSGR